MTIDDFTTFLGKDVVFIVNSFNGFFSYISGRVTAVNVCENLLDSEFLVNDEFYKFQEVKFVQNLPNPCENFI